MDIKKFEFNSFKENTYVVYSSNGDAAIIDPGCVTQDEIKELTNFIAGKVLIPRFLINTHCHYDHILGNAFIKARYDIPICANKEDEFLIKSADTIFQNLGLDAVRPFNIDIYLEESTTLSLGNEKLEFVHLPGHSPGSMGIYSKNDEFIIVGDVLFKGAIGRTDLPGGDYDKLMHSIRKKLFKFDDETVVYPGHGPETTIGMELKTNPFLF